MKNDNFNLNGSITIYYKNEVLMDELQYRLLNMILTDGALSNAMNQLNLTNSKALSLISRMNKLAPKKIVESDKNKENPVFQISEFGMKLLNSYAQKEFELYMFLKKGNQHLNNSFMTTMEKNIPSLADVS